MKFIKDFQIRSEEYFSGNVHVMRYIQLHNNTKARLNGPNLLVLYSPGAFLLNTLMNLKCVITVKAYREPKRIHEVLLRNQSGEKG